MLTRFLSGGEVKREAIDHAISLAHPKSEATNVAAPHPGNGRDL